MKIHSIVIAVLLLCVKGLSAQNALSDSLIAWYPFTNNAIDSSGNGNDGTVSGATLADDRFGNANSAYNFDGIDDYIDILANSNFQPTSFPISICAWIKANCDYPSGCFFKTDNLANQYTGVLFQVVTASGGILEIHYGDGGTTGSCCRRSGYGSTNVNDNQWHFVAAIIRSQSDMDVYVDCNYDNETYSGTGGGLYYSGADGVMGYADVVSGTYRYKGILDDIRYYHRELTLTDLQMLYAYPAPYGLTSATVSLGNDTVICSSDPITLNPVTSGTIQSYTWSDGSTDSVLQAYFPGQYSVQVFDGCGIVSDTINIVKGFVVPVELPADTTLCEGTFFVLDAGSGYDSYEWSNGAFTESIIVNTSGTYTVTVTQNGCPSTDTVALEFVVCDGVGSLAQTKFNAWFDDVENDLFISFPSLKNENCDVKIFNMNGTLIQQKEISEMNPVSSIHLKQQLSYGVYLVSLADESSSGFFRLVKVK